MSSYFSLSKTVRSGKLLSLILLPMVLVALLAAGCGDGEDAPPTTQHDTSVADQDLGTTDECDQGMLLCSDTCVDPLTNQDHCGECDNPCEEWQTCTEGECLPLCPDGQSTCDDDQCHDLQTSNAHCGECDNPCEEGEDCVDGECVITCDGEETLCGDACVNLQTDPEHCGKCDNPCDGEMVCSAGECTVECGDELTQCGQSCVDLETNRDHCGECDQPCPEGDSCEAGECVLQCGDDLELCGEAGCRDLLTDDAHCGECDNQCDEGLYCVSGECAALPTGVELANNTMSLAMGSEAQLTATILPEGAVAAETIWESDSPEVATVSDTGLVVPVSTGNARVTITIQAAGKRYFDYCIIRVWQPPTRITVDPESMSLLPGDSGTVTATVEPDDATGYEIRWASSAPGVASVTQEGEVTAIANGVSNITATLFIDGVEMGGDQGNNGNGESGGGNGDEGNGNGEEAGATSPYKATCVVAVSNTPVTGVLVSPPQVEINRGESVTLTATVSPEDATNKDVIWTSSNLGVAQVNSSGVVTGTGAGTTTVVATTVDSRYTSSANVQVNVPVTSVRLNKTSLTLVRFSEEILSATVSPMDAANKDVIWSSSREDVATVSSSGRVSAIGVGDTTISVTTVEGGFTARCQVTVWVPVTDIIVTPASLLLSPGESGELSAQVVPVEATNPEVVWSSKNSSVATVDDEGLVKAISLGETAVLITAVHDNVTIEVPVSVRVKVTGVDIYPPVRWMNVDDVITMAADVFPENASEKQVTWRSSDPDKVSVTSAGVVTAHETNANVTITATTAESGFTASCMVYTSLFTFFDHTFTTCNASGRSGPTQANCTYLYSTVWDENPEFYTVTGGIHKWTVPRSGVYRIEVWGAEGGSSGGKGARMRGDFELVRGEKLKILVGQKGGDGSSYNTGGGGGGTFVTKEDNTPLIIAGGGGGRGGYTNTNYNAPTSNSGNTGHWGGGGGSNGTGGSASDGGGGAGLTGNGSGSYSGSSFVNGGAGGSRYNTNSGLGGFGGGAGGRYNCCCDSSGSGGGGGYSGGGGGGRSGYCYDYGGGAGGGGGSYNDGENQSNTAGTNTGHGKMTIHLLPDVF